MSLYADFKRRRRQARQVVFDIISEKDLQLLEKHIDGNTDVHKILAFIEYAREAAVDVLDVCQRDTIRKMLHRWATIVYDEVGYPETDLETPAVWRRSKDQHRFMYRERMYECAGLL